MKKSLRYFSVVLAGVFIATIAFESLSYARAGGGRSSGSRSFRSAPAPQRSYNRPAQNQNQKGNLLKSVGGGILGGMLGGMLFRSLGFGGGMGGGILQLIIIAAIGYFIFKFIRSRTNPARGAPAQTRAPINHGSLFREDSASTANTGGMLHSSPSFDERSFKDSVMDMFFRIQAAWMHRDLSPVSDILNSRMKEYLQEDIDRLISGKKINKVENIAVRSVDITESWQEDGFDCITVRVYATVLDYTVDETTGAVIEGSKTEPVKFEEYWTFEKAANSTRWQMAAINQI